MKTSFLSLNKKLVKADIQLSQFLVSIAGKIVCYWEKKHEYKALKSKRNFICQETLKLRL